MNAERIEQQAAEWLQRREQSGWGAADQAALDAWLDEAAAHKLAYWRLEHGWAKVGRLAALREVSPPVRARSRGSWPWKPVAVAASLAAMAAIGTALFDVLPGSGKERYETRVGGRQTVPLQDGSRMELATNTQVRANVTAETREVWIDRGEVYFEVRHDARRPFVVWAGERKVTVLGTTFSVRRDHDQVRVAVVEGRVRVEPAKSDVQARAEVLTQGGIAVARGASTLVTAGSADQVANALSWRRGMLAFDQAMLAEVAAEFNRYNETKLVLVDPDAAQIRIGGTFEAKNADAFARLLGSAYGLKLVERNGEIEISH